jgi:hypothetical protein
MGKVLGIGAIVIAVWVAAEVLDKGAAGAFGGLLVKLGLEQAVQPSDGTPLDPDSVPARFVDRYRGAHQTGVDRVERQLD